MMYSSLLFLLAELSSSCCMSHSTGSLTGIKVLVTTTCPELSMRKGSELGCSPKGYITLSYPAVKVDMDYDSSGKAAGLPSKKMKLRNKNMKNQSTCPWTTKGGRVCLKWYLKNQYGSLSALVRSFHHNWVNAGDYCKAVYGHKLGRASFFIEQPSFHCLQRMHLPAWQFMESLNSAMSFHFYAAKKHVPSATASTCVHLKTGRKAF